MNAPNDNAGANSGDVAGGNEGPTGDSAAELPQVEELPSEEAVDRIGALIDAIEQQPDEQLRAQVFELLDWMEAYNREAVHRLIDLLSPEALTEAREDPILVPLLEAFEVDLGEEEEDPMPLVEEALQQVRPYIHSHGGEMELLGVEDGVVRLRLMGSCDGCPSSTITLSQGVEEAIRQRWGGMRRLDVETPEGVRPQPKLLQIQTLRRQDP